MCRRLLTLRETTSQEETLQEECTEAENELIKSVEFQFTLLEQNLKQPNCLAYNNPVTKTREEKKSRFCRMNSVCYSSNMDWQ